MEMRFWLVLACVVAAVGPVWASKEDAADGTYASGSAAADAQTKDAEKKKNACEADTRKDKGEKDDPSSAQGSEKKPDQSGCTAVDFTKGATKPNGGAAQATDPNSPLGKLEARDAAESMVSSNPTGSESGNILQTKGSGAFGSGNLFDSTPMSQQKIDLNQNAQPTPEQFKMGSVNTNGVNRWSEAYNKDSGFTAPQQVGNVNAEAVKTVDVKGYSLDTFGKFTETSKYNDLVNQNAGKFVNSAPSGYSAEQGYNTGWFSKTTKQFVDLATGVKTGVAVGYSVDSKTGSFGEARNANSQTGAHIHKGVDLNGGGTVRSSMEGKVTRVGTGSGYGNVVEVTDANGNVTRYAHLADSSVKVGDKVMLGQALGTEGGTSAGSLGGPAYKAYGSHLHFEVLTANGTQVASNGSVGQQILSSNYYNAGGSYGSGLQPSLIVNGDTLGNAMAQAVQHLGGAAQTLLGPGGPMGNIMSALTGQGMNPMQQMMMQQLMRQMAGGQNGGSGYSYPSSYASSSGTQTTDTTTQTAGLGSTTSTSSTVLSSNTLVHVGSLLDLLNNGLLHKKNGKWVCDFQDVTVDNRDLVNSLCDSNTGLLRVGAI